MKAYKAEHPTTHFYAFDSFVVDEGKSVLLREGQPVPLTPKAFEILLVLVRNPGRVLKKEELIDEVWPEAFVDENNLPRNISSLRKALGEGPAEHKYIVTLPGQGYRFVAEVRQLDSPNGAPTRSLLQTVPLESTKAEPEITVREEVARPEPATSNSPSITLKVVCASLALALAISGYFLVQRWLHPSQPTPPQRKLSQLTFEPGLETDPSWSPDGRFVAYSSDQSGNFDIWVRSIGEGNSVQVTSSPAHDWQPNWSPDGLSLVFRSEREGGGLYIVPALGGSERKLCDFGYRPRWSPDGSQVLFYSSAYTAAVKSKAHVINSTGGTPRDVLSDFAPQFVSILLVAWHPDGNRLSVWGNQLQAGWSFWTVPLNGGAALQSQIDPAVQSQLKEAGVRFVDFLWMPSANGLIFEGESQGVRNLWKIKVDPATLRWIDGLERITTGAGKDTDIAVSADARKLAFSIRSERSRLWSVPFDPIAGKTTGPSQPLTLPGMDALQPGLSPDGKMLVFRKRHADKEELWAKSLADGRETLLTGADDFRRVNPILSNDGTRLIYVRSGPAQVETDPQLSRTLALRTTSGGDEQILTSPMQGRMIMPNIIQLEMALTSDRIILPMMETSGSIWVLENVDR